MVAIPFPKNMFQQDKKLVIQTMPRDDQKI